MPDPIGFVLQGPPSESRTYDLEIVPPQAVLGEVSFSAAPRESTNIIDVSLVHPDPMLVAPILNQAGRALREKGAERVRQAARADIDFINDRLDSAQAQLSKSMDAIRDFKKTQAFTNLSARERSLVDRQEALATQIERVNAQRKALSVLVSSQRASGLHEVDLPALLAQLPEGSAPQVRSLVGDIQKEQAEERRLITEDRMSPGTRRWWPCARRSRSWVTNSRTPPPPRCRWWRTDSRS